MIRDEEILREINELWEPVYPFLAEHLLGAAGGRCRALLDLGPFAGGIAAAALEREGSCRAVVADAAAPVLRWARRWAAARGVAERLRAVEAPLGPLPFPTGAFDRVAVRGAFFFLTPALLGEVGRVVRPGGFGWVGGGYGPATPEDVIGPIAARSKYLNEAVGKRRISFREAEGLVAAAGLQGCARVSGEGGLWIEVRP
ncbi:MAG: hypothetical protein Kow0092_15570 [Deferrisomatales bacterium]